ncbi:endonuclease/exonuclease/phosphatase family protein [Streptomyces sp. NPDC047014]|uniref:endonuclease/exonuclease/phosphatase family protein n=1 Tax=Streptomyces sp. NPDC047014 TaxID=3155736 RepID=UPI003401D785
MCVHSTSPWEAPVWSKATRWAAGAMTAACLLLLLGPSAPGGGGPAPLPPGAAEEVVPDRVATWNICNPCGGSGRNYGRATDIATYAPQVIGLQEACVRDVEQIRTYLEEVYGLVYHVAYGPVLRNWNRCGGLPWHPGGYGQAILSAAPMTDRVSVAYPDGGSEDRGYLAVTTLVAGRPVRVFNTHLAERRQAEVRAAQVRRLAAAVARHPRAIALGDFNARPQAAELAPMWPLSTDADPACRSTATPSDACTPTTDWSSKFDYLFLRALTPRTHAVHPTPNSDHHLLHADLDGG